MSRMTDFCDIICDTCTQWVEGSMTSTLMQRKALKYDGWRVIKTPSGLQDVCPACSGADLQYWTKLRFPLGTKRNG